MIDFFNVRWDVAPVSTFTKLIKSRVNINDIMYFGKTPLHWAVNRYNYLGINVIRKLLNNGANVNLTNDFEMMCPLHSAVTVFGGSSDVIQSLIDNGANVNARNKYKVTPLHIFASHNTGDDRNLSTYSLINAGADVNAIDCDGETPLITAIINSYSTSMIDILINNGADGNIRDRRGKTAYDYVKENENWDEDVRATIKMKLMFM